MMIIKTNIQNSLLIIHSILQPQFPKRLASLTWRFAPPLAESPPIVKSGDDLDEISISLFYLSTYRYYPPFNLSRPPWRAHLSSRNTPRLRAQPP